MWKRAGFVLVTERADATKFTQNLAYHEENLYFLILFRKKLITELQELEGASGDHRVQPPCKAGFLQQAAKVGIQASLEYLQRRNSTTSLGHLWVIGCRTVPQAGGHSPKLTEFEKPLDNTVGFRFWVVLCGTRTAP